MILKEAIELVGGLSKPSKMPCQGYSISARLCKVGAKLREVAGSVCEGCYALKGRYFYPNVKDAMQRRLESLSDPLWVDAMTIAIGQTEMTDYFRIHDSGDLQGDWHLEKWMDVAENLPEIKFWLPTREYAIVNAVLSKRKCPRNLIIRLSAYMIDGPLPVALAQKLGVDVSGVSADKGQVNCPAPSQGNKCLRCRLCWTKGKTVIYQKH